MQERPVSKKELANQKSILDIAQSLGMQLKKAGKNYVWQEHDSFSISPEKNIWTWWSRGDEYRGQDVIKLVEVVRGVSFKEAVNFILGIEASPFDVTKVPPKEPFVYKMKEKSFDYSRKFLKDVRGLSDETIDFFLSKGVLAQSTWRRPDGTFEPVIVFKNFNREGKIVGASVQGMIYNKDYYPKRGRLKQILKNSDGYSGVVIDVGNRQTHPPFVLYAFEAPLDMMAYYELHREMLQDACLVSMDGFKQGTISTVIADTLATESAKAVIDKTFGRQNYLKEGDKNRVFENNLKIVLCVDNDEAGRNFIQNFGLKYTQVVSHLPPLTPGQTKNDWNDQLKAVKAEKVVLEMKESSRLSSQEFSPNL